MGKTPQLSEDSMGIERLERTRLAQRPSAGHGWGMRRNLLQRLNLYDSMIFGTGDMAIALAGMGLHQQYAEGYPLCNSHRRHYLNWAEQFYQLVDGQVVSIPGSVNHLYHGNFSDRQYGSRLQVMAKHQFDPEADIALTSPGVWRWQGEAAFRYDHYMRSYFPGRADDCPDRLSGQ